MKSNIEISQNIKNRITMIRYAVSGYKAKENIEHVCRSSNLMFFLLFSCTEKSLLVNETNPGQKDKP